MKTDSKISYFFIVSFLLGIIVGAVVFRNKEIPDQLTLTVKSIYNDHDVILKDQRGFVYVMSVENAYAGIFIPGTIIYFGKNEVIIK
jgi:hypothetical protein